MPSAVSLLGKVFGLVHLRRSLDRELGNDLHGDSKRLHLVMAKNSSFFKDNMEES